HQAELPLGPAGRGGSSARRRCRDSRSQTRLAAAVGFARRDDRSPRRAPHRLPGCSLRHALYRLRRQGSRCGSAEAAREDRAQRGARALLLQAARDQGRVRSRAAVHRWRIRQACRRAVRGRLQAPLSPGPSADEQTRREDRRAEEEQLRTVDDERVPRARETEGSARDRVRCLQQDRGTEAGASAHHRLRSADRRAAAAARGAQPCAGGRTRQHSRTDPRLRPRQGSAPKGGEGEGGRTRRGVPGREARQRGGRARRGIARLDMDPPFDLSGKTALVTGAYRGLGFAIARGLARAGARVVLNGRKSTEVNEAADKLREQGLAAGASVFDVTDRAAVRAAVEAIRAEHGSVDILFNNAGIQRRGPLVDFAQEDWDAVLATNLTAPFIVSQAVLPAMIANKRGKIVHIASLMSELARPSVVPYTAAKGGGRQLTRGMAVERAPHNIQVNP